MRFLFIASGRTTPSTRFRIEPYLPALRAAGHRCDIAYSFPQKYEYFPWLGWRISQRLKRTVRHWHAWLAHRRRYDAIYIEREVFDDDTSDLEAKFRAATKRLILDVDDGVFLRFPKKFERITKMCDSVVAGNQFLRDYLQPWCADVREIPTCISLADYPIRKINVGRGHDAGQTTIGWIGTAHNVVFLQVAAPALRQLAKRHSFRLLIVGRDDRLGEVDLSGVNVEFRDWDANRDVADLHEMDIGIMPLPDGEDWMKYKCGLKLLQYLAVGIPGVASPIGVNQAIMAGELVGRSARNDAQWESSLEELIVNPKLRETLGLAGRELVKEKYSIEANWPNLESVLMGKPSPGLHADA